MKAEFQNSYPKRTKTGNVVDVFVYSVDGTAEELAAYQDAKGAEYREDSETGKPLWFSLNYVGESCPMIITTNGNVVADTSMLRKAANLAGQYDFLKDQLAERLLTGIGFGRQSNRASIQNAAPKAESKTEEPAGSASTSGTEDPIVTEEGIDPFKI